MARRNFKKLKKVFNCRVPNQRRAGQTFLGLQISAELFQLVNKARKDLRMDRSTFVREAIAEKLRTMGYDVPASMVDPPDRADPEEPKLDPGKIIVVPAPASGPTDADSDDPRSLRVAETTEVSTPGPRTKVKYRKAKKPR